MSNHDQDLAFTGALEARDLIPGFYYTSWNRSWLYKAIAGIALLILLAFFGQIALGGLPDGWYGILWPILIYAYFAYLPALQAKSVMKSQKQMGEEGRYEVSSVGLQIAKPSVQVAIPWSGVHSIVELKDQFLVYTTKSCFVAVPKRFLPGDRLNQWRSIVSAHHPIQGPGRNRS